MQTFSGEQGWNTEGNAFLSTVIDVELRGSEFVVGPLFLHLGIFPRFSGFPSSANFLMHLIFTQNKFISD